MSQEKVLIVGTGALACLFAARLASHTHVTLLGSWPEGLAALRRDGVRLVDADGSEKTFPVRATNDPADCTDHPFAIVLVKSWQTVRAARQLAACLSEDGVALTLQNGLGNLEQLQDELGEERAALGVTTTGATLLDPGHVRVGGTGPTHVASHPRLAPFVALIRQAGFEVETVDDLDGVVWGKLVVNAGINPLTALLGVPNGELLQRPEARALMRAAASEAANVAAALGVRIPYDDPVVVVEDVARRTATNRSSMLQDVARGAPTEIDAISGAIVEHGERLGVATPVNWTLWHLIRAQISSP
ncbi:MAG: 2-dehydropantoate 2-reductase [Anaerolineales bacterium]|nr:2-dehydropantoate 2-reductase [Anaerolineales bacterium]